MFTKQEERIKTQKQLERCIKVYLFILLSSLILLQIVPLLGGIGVIGAVAGGKYIFWRYNNA